jgi:putative ATP-dependent endonuclease of OLD family
VNHFWRLLEGIGIPYVTLLDLDAGRNKGGWGRLKYAMRQLHLHSGTDRFADIEIDELPSWDDQSRPDKDKVGQLLIDRLEKLGVFFSAPLDLDYSMLAAYPSPYGVTVSELVDPDESTIKAVLGKAPGPVDQLYDSEEQQLFEPYRERFKSSSKPAQHLKAMAALTDEVLINDLPPAYVRIIASIGERLQAIPE